MFWFNRIVRSSRDKELSFKVNRVPIINAMPISCLHLSLVGIKIFHSHVGDGSSRVTMAHLRFSFLEILLDEVCKIDAKITINVNSILIVWHSIKLLWMLNVLF